MNLRNLNLVNFRNYSKIDIKLNNTMNIFVGDNAQGKTNILESITILALTKSHRVFNNPNIIKIGKSKTSIKGTLVKNKIISKLQVDIDDSGKKLFINKNNIKRVSDYITNFNVIVFSPGDLEIVSGSPNVRRNLLNTQLSQLSREYLNTYNQYNKLLKTRNEYLKILFNNNIADKDYLDIITDKLIEKAIFIYQKRKEYIDLVNSSINKFYKDICNDEGISIEYINNVSFSDFEYETIRKSLKHIFKKNYMKELNYGMTLYGPHRDDFYFKKDNLDLKYYGSQGQQRLAILSFKLGEIDIFNNISGFKPVLLLDDIFSELDLKKRNRLLKIVNNYNIQSIITTTDLKNINKKYLENAFIFLVKDGNVERK